MVGPGGDGERTAGIDWIDLAGGGCPDWAFVRSTRRDSLLGFMDRRLVFKMGNGLSFSHPDNCPLGQHYYVMLLC